MSLTRRGFLLGSAALAVAAAARPTFARPVRGARATYGSIVPDSPLWLSLVGSSGQFVATWHAVTTLIGGAAITSNPITSYSYRWGTTEASVRVGGTPTGTASVAGATATRSGLAAGTWWVVIIATNAAGDSEYSFPQSVTVS